jgi:AraC family transcriptional regulator
MLICKWGRPAPGTQAFSLVRLESQTIESPVLPEQSVSLVPAGLPFEWEWTYLSESIHLLIPPCAVQRVAEEMPGKSPGGNEILPQFHTHDPLVLTLMERLRNEVMGTGYGTLLAVESVLNLLSLHIVHTYAEKSPAQQVDSSGLSSGQRKRVSLLLEERFHENLRLEELAQVAGLSPFHFARLFKRSFGVPPHEYQIQKRVEVARRILHTEAETDLTTIAATLGFTDESHFRRHFKRIVGTTPGQYRQQNKQYRTAVAQHRSLRTVTNNI